MLVGLRLLHGYCRVVFDCTSVPMFHAASTASLYSVSIEPYGILCWHEQSGQRCMLAENQSLVVSAQVEIFPCSTMLNVYLVVECIAWGSIIPVDVGQCTYSLIELPGKGVSGNHGIRCGLYRDVFVKK